MTVSSLGGDPADNVDGDSPGDLAGDRAGDPVDDLDEVWKALANPLRRQILDLLAAGPVTTGDMAARFPELSRFAIMQHLGVLEKADLLIVRRDGRRRFNHLNPVPIQRISDRWISRYHQPWTEALVDLKSALEAEQETGEVSA